jgi:hypothetical protein
VIQKKYPILLCRVFLRTPSLHRPSSEMNCHKTTTATTTTTKASSKCRGGSSSLGVREELYTKTSISLLLFHQK